ncbi:4-diphosphocytidyl-2C-methyl-D-erythritol synthase [Ruegeria sp. ANG-S4]|uniref:nucleotidyltransferase family protein n=1 Tax=Ruegeria sp. ANG-S4 TaxID=1577904 RepID=UPI00057E637C|nr:nucleotidyltransferase family protein [Ruegeria sp. ANG-S4]KIC44222.1 4-diphosphocytidyl-2C-methyl-D-erythritol synthase [Ruegeria sp. ANG-S4]
MKPVPVILLAAGQSSRMGVGVDKLMQPIDGAPLLRRTAQRALSVGPVFAALPPAPHPRYEALEGLGVQMVPVPDAVEGMNASLRAALARVAPDAETVMVLLSDLPDLSAQDLSDVARTVDTHPDNLIWRATTTDGVPGHPVIFHKSLFGALAALRGDDGAQSVVKSCRGKVHHHPLPDMRALQDLDTPEDWAAWRARH